MSTDEYPSEEARQAWFDLQDAAEDDFYFMDIDTTGKLLDCGLACTGDALPD